MRNALTTVANIAIVVSALVIVGVTLLPRALPRSRPASLPAVGTRLSGLQQVDFTRHDVTCVLFLKTDCRFCTESMAFYRTLLGLRQRNNRIGFVAVSPEDIGSLTRYLSGHGLSVDSVVSVPAGESGVLATPTLIVVDRQRKVILATAGLLADARQQQVYELLGQLVTSVSQ
jgi:peroxiredoxin